MFVHNRKSETSAKHDNDNPSGYSTKPTNQTSPSLRRQDALSGALSCPPRPNLHRSARHPMCPWGSWPYSYAHALYLHTMHACTRLTTKFQSMPNTTSYNRSSRPNSKLPANTTMTSQQARPNEVSIPDVFNLKPRILQKERGNYPYQSKHDNLHPSDVETNNFHPVQLP